MKLTIALVTMNRAEQLKRAINSCLSCTLPDDTEFVIVDNASNDQTEETIKDMFSKCKYTCQYYRFEENVGAGAGRNKYFEMASGEYVYGMDDDAIVDSDKNPDFFVKAISILDNNSQIAALATQIYDEAWGKNRQEIRGKEIIPGIYMCKMFCEGSHFLRKSFFEDAPYLPNKYGYEGLVPSLIIWDKGYINAYCPSLLAIHQPKVNKWNYTDEANYKLLINECAIPYAIKQMMYPIIFRPILYCAFKKRIIRYLKNVPGSFPLVKKVTEDMKNNYYVSYVISCRTVIRLFKEFGISIF